MAAADFSGAKGGLASAALVLAWSGWVIQFLGMCMCQNNCSDSGDDPSVLPLYGLNGFSGRASCQDIFRFWWWVCWFLFFATLAFSIFSCIPGLVRRSALGWTAVMAVLSTLLMLQADSFLNTQQTAYYTQGAAERYTRTVVAGSVIAAFATGLLAFVLAMKQKSQQAPAA